MARKWLRDIVLCCMPLIFSPGCQHLAATGSGRGDDLREPVALRQQADAAAAASAAQSDVPASPMPERKVMSTAMAQDPLVHRETKKQADPPPDQVRGLGQLPDLPIPGKPADLPKTPKQEAARPEAAKPAAAGKSGVVGPGNDRPEIEPIQPAAGVQTSPPPALPPLPMAGSKKSDKREYAPVSECPGASVHCWRRNIRRRFNICPQVRIRKRRSFSAAGAYPDHACQETDR